MTHPLTQPLTRPPDSVAPGDLPVAEFTAAAQRAVRWVAEYLAHPERHAVLPAVVPGEVRGALPGSPPDEPEGLAEILADFERVVVPGLTHWNHPGFFAYFSVSSSAPGIVAELLAAALNVNGMLWRTSPSATELEQLSLDWLRQMLGLPNDEVVPWFGMITDTASISTLLGLAAAREAAAGGSLLVRERGLAGRADVPAMRVYASAHAHSSVDKAAIALGLGHENVVHVDVDAEFRMRPEHLAALVAADRRRGLLPIACVATVGTTSTTSVDPVPAVADVCAHEGLWLHVDGAYGGVAAIVPELRWVFDGVARADSLVVNPHKWLFTPIDCSAFYTRRPEVLKRAFALVPEYLTTTAPGEVVNYMDYGVQLGRRFRALKLWMVIRAFGVTGLQERIRHHVALAQEFAGWVEAEPGWEIMAPHPLSLVCFRYAPNDTSAAERNALNERILAAVNAGGRVYLSHTKLGDAYTLRLAVGNVRTQQEHVAEAWRLLREAAGRAIVAV